jgi:hypothetical protein
VGIGCRLFGHKVDPSAILWNDGLSHSRCRRCGAHLIRRSVTWRPVPRGYRVVWRAPAAGETVWTKGPAGWSSLFREAAVPDAPPSLERPAS